MGDLSHIPGPSPRDRLREVRRLALLEAAEQVFAEKGYAGAKMAEIAARAGYSAGSVYNAFDGKQDLFQTLLAWRGQEALEHVRAVLGACEELPAAELIARLVDLGFSYWAERPAFFRIYQDVARDLDWAEGPIGHSGIRVREELEALVEARLAHAMARGELAPGEPRLYTALVFGTLNRAVAQWMQHGEGPEPRAPAREDLRVLLCRALGVSS